MNHPCLIFVEYGERPTACKKQGVRETIDFKSQMANYRPSIKNKKHIL